MEICLEILKNQQQTLQVDFVFFNRMARDFSALVVEGMELMRFQIFAQWIPGFAVFRAVFTSATLSVKEIL